MKKILLIASVLVAACAVSCTKETKVEDAVTIKSDDATVPVEGGVVSIAINSTVAWTAKASESWVTISPSSGEAGDATVKASVLKNDTNDSRTATVTFTAGTKSATYTITQSQLDAMNIATTEYTVEAAGGTVEIPVSANVDYSVIIPDAVDWIHVVSTKGMVDSKITLSVDGTNLYVKDEETGEILEDAVARSAKITVSAGGLEQVVTVSQKAFVPYFDFTGDWAGLQWSHYFGGPTVIPQEGADITIGVDTNIDEWRVFFSVWDNDQGAMVDSWDLGWARLSYDVEQSQIHLVIDPNDTYVPRENYLYAECTIDGAVSGDFGGLGFFRQDGLVPEAGATVLWTKLLSEVGVPSSPYHRLAYKTLNGDALLISDGENVHALSPSDGTHWKTISWGIKPTSICSDDAGNVIVAPDYPFENGTTYSVYYAQDVNQEPVKLFDHTADFSGTIGGWRVRGDITKRAVVTGFVGASRYWAGWEIDNLAVSLDNYYNVNGQTRGPINGNNDSWTPEAGAVMSLGNRLNEGIVYRAYDGLQNLYFLKDAYTPAWQTPYDWKMISEAGAGGNECQNNMDIIDYNGRRIMAYTQGLYWGYGGNASVYILDITNPEACEVVAILEGTELASVDTFVVGEDYGWATLNAYVSADVKLHVEEGVGLVCYVVNSTMESLSKLLISF